LRGGRFGTNLGEAIISVAATTKQASLQRILTFRQPIDIATEQESVRTSGRGEI